MSFTPVRVDNTNNGAAAPSFFDQDLANHQPVKFGANFYYVLYDNFSGFFEVMKSTDDQQTWHVSAQTGAGFPGAGIFSTGWCVYFDGTILYVAFINSAGIGTRGINFIKYNCATETLSAIYGTVGNPNITLQGFAVRSTDSAHIVLVTNLPSALIQPSYYLYDPVGNAWTGPFDLFTNVVGGGHPYTAGGLRGAIQASGRMHTFFTYQDGGGSLHLFWQALETNNTLGNHFDFGPGQVGKEVNDFKVILDETNQNIVLSFNDATAGNFDMLFGTPFGTPVWSALTIIEAGIFPDGAPQLFLVNGVLYATTDANSQQQILQWQTSNLVNPIAGWSPHSVIFDSSQTTIAGWFQNSLVSPTIVAGSLGLYFVNPDPTNTFLLEWFMPLASPAPAVPIQLRAIPEPIPLPNPCCVEDLKHTIDMYSDEELRIL